MESEAHKRREEKNFKLRQKFAQRQSCQALLNSCNRKITYPEKRMILTELDAPQGDLDSL
jgi:hypothetical protein